ncbi:glycan metabolism protein RagB [Pedobacter lusitanus]|uniref:Contig34, whole genome shotgun sequence n=1 Tax=Pedobacter lusitanus TaxID=1503925 RepID=A0A0D0FY28_9SPHI|nr:RagB/SusD family nutrient uptake outer membrane protein [Pedobacter lusitanus]KIO77439.1 glycan metabolism protein RagB [Pedobacter lusitanus]
MKTISSYILTAAILLSFSSCKKFLDREPIAQITPENIFTSQQGAQSAVMGVYRTQLGPFSYGQSLVIVPEFSARHVNHVSSFPEYVDFKTNSIRIDNPWVQNIWTAGYAAINAANNVVTKVAAMPEGSIDPDKRQQFVKEGRFIRALNYFNLVRAFGDVPLVLAPTGENDNLKIPRNTVAEIYAQIIADLKEASTLPNSYANITETKGRATGNAAKALLAKVYLYNGSVTNTYTEAARLAQEVISTSGTSMPVDFGSIWTTKNTSESIFELQFDAQATNALAGVSNPNASVLFFAEGKSIADLYDAADKRGKFTIYQNTAADARYYIGKYRMFNPAIQNFPVIRLAEIYLIHAEAQARVDGSVSAAAYGSYKKVLDRAGITAPDISSFTSLAAFITAVQHEKRKEMMFEGEAWFDYCRTGLALTEMMSKADPNYYLYPIPDAERRNNPSLTQNKGY